MNHSLQDFQENYETDFPAIEQKIMNSRAKTVILQFPDGLKPYATAVAEYFKEKFPKTLFTIWLGSCFGACDIPQVEGKADLVIQFGHSAWKNQ